MAPDRFDEFASKLSPSEAKLVSSARPLLMEKWKRMETTKIKEKLDEKDAANQERLDGANRALAHEQTLHKTTTDNLIWSRSQMGILKARAEESAVHEEKLDQRINELTKELAAAKREAKRNLKLVEYYQLQKEKLAEEEDSTTESTDEVSDLKAKLKVAIDLIKTLEFQEKDLIKRRDIAEKDAEAAKEKATIAENDAVAANDRATNAENDAVAAKDRAIAAQNTMVALTNSGQDLQTRFNNTTAHLGCLQQEHKNLQASSQVQNSTIQQLRNKLNAAYSSGQVQQLIDEAKKSIIDEANKELSQRDHTIQANQHRIIELEQANNNLQCHVDAKNREIEQATTFGEPSQQSESSPSQDVEMAGSRTTELIQQNADLQNQLHGKAATEVEQANKIANLTTELASMQNSLDEKTATEVEQANKITNLTTELASIQNSLDEKTATETENSNKITSLTTELASLQNSLVKKAAELAKQESELTSLREKVMSLKNDLDSAKIDKESLLGEQDKRNAAGDEKLTVEMQLEEAKAEIQRLKVTTVSAILHRNLLRAVSSKRYQVEEQSNVIKNLKAKIRSIERGIEGAEESLKKDDMIAENSRLKEELGEAKEKISSLPKDPDHAEDSITQNTTTTQTAEPAANSTNLATDTSAMAGTVTITTATITAVSYRSKARKLLHQQLRKQNGDRTELQIIHDLLTEPDRPYFQSKTGQLHGPDETRTITSRLASTLLPATPIPARQQTDEPRIGLDFVGGRLRAQDPASAGPERTVNIVNETIDNTGMDFAGENLHEPDPASAGPEILVSIVKPRCPSAGEATCFVLLLWLCAYLLVAFSRTS